MIKNKWFPQEVIEIAKKIEEKGGELFLVGGSVRDLILKIIPKEYDFEIHGNVSKKEEYLSMPEKEKEKFITDFVENIKVTLEEFGEISQQGKSFGVIKMAQKPYDFSFPRTENKKGLTRQEYDITINPFIEYREAQKRRDITINTIMYSLSREILIDNFNGLVDIQQKIIRYVDNETFIEDPLRVYRIAQFVSRFNFTVDKNTLELCKKMDLSTLSVERIQWEFEKLLKGKDILAGINFLMESKVLLKRHFDFESLLNSNVNTHKEINKINYYIEENMKMTERFIFISLLFGKNFDDKGFENYLGKIKRIYLSFSKNKKDINQALDKICNFKTLADYYNGNIDYQEGIFLLVNRDLKYLDLYFKSLYGDDKKTEILLKEAKEFKQLIKGTDLLALGIEESENFKDLLSESIKLQTSGLKKEEILLQIKRRDLK